jgi:hypothetical protein
MQTKWQQVRKMSRMPLAGFALCLLALLLGRLFFIKSLHEAY